MLALDTSGRACSAALATMDGEVLAERLHLDGPAHAQQLMPAVHEVLGERGASLDDVSVVVVALGPGAYTGMRIGVATARALAHAGGCRLGGVPTPSALAVALSEAPEAPGHDVLVPLVDGRRNEVFAAPFGRAGGRREPSDGCPVASLADLSVVPAQEIAAYLGGWSRVLVGGDGAVVHADRLPPAAARAAAVAAPTAAMVARAWACGAPGRVEGFGHVLPVYGRAPDAARWHGTAAP